VSCEAAIRCGEMHYARIPRAHWRNRMEFARAMGLNAISTYVFWNLHEPRPGCYDFAGDNDVAAYVREAAACELAVVLRPGPYVCAEWDFGGLPAWLLASPDPPLRTADERYMTPVRRWLRRLGQELAPLQRTRGGPIIAVQLENEYGAYGGDAAYLCALRAALDDAGFGDTPYYTIDQPVDLARGSLPGLPAGVTFAPGDPERDLAAARALHPACPPICGEYWDGWYDRWGEPHQVRDEAVQRADLEWMLRSGCHFNLYMFCGGTNFGFFNGANASHDQSYAPVTTSYDYLAPLDEAGRPTPKYFAFREAIAACENVALPPLPAIPPTIAIEPFELDRCAPLWQMLRDPVRSQRPQPMERLGQSFGFTLYRTTLRAPGDGWLEIEEVHDYASVFLNGALCGRLDRRKGESGLELHVPDPGARLEILVENCGRANYGPLLAGESKGITRAVRWNGRELVGWEIFALPLDDLSGLSFSQRRADGPAFFSGTFRLAAPHDTFLETIELGKGVLFVNGRNAGRYWRLGPQQALYVPASWLRAGSNDVVAFDVMGPVRPRLRGLRYMRVYDGASQADN
jgi:beta-galactosidase